MLSNPISAKIVDFIERIGLPVWYRAIDDPTVLPGIDTRDGGLVIDETRMLYPGDLLHEAGHLAVLTPEERNVSRPDLSQPAGELGAIAWSWAAAVHLQIDPRIVFHPHGYRGGSDALIENFEAGRFIGVPFLGWIGLTSVPTYPQMRMWLRASPHSQL